MPRVKSIKAVDRSLGQFMVRLEMRLTKQEIARGFAGQLFTNLINVRLTEILFLLEGLSYRPRTRRRGLRAPVRSRSISKETLRFVSRRRRCCDLRGGSLHAMVVASSGQKKTPASAD
jgi:hypothetical protein